MPRRSPNPAGNPTYRGPRLYGRGKPKPGGMGAIVDPADGERVPRCRVCGMPGTPDVKLLYGLWVRGPFSMTVILCEREVPPLDPMTGDPLTVVA